MKIVIRKWAKEDIPVLAALANNYNVWKNLRDGLPHPYLQKDAEEWIDFTLSQEPVCNFAIEADGIAAGAIGFTQQQDIHRKNIEIGYYVGELFWGRGIATEAVKQMVEMLANSFDVVRIYACVFETNPGSMRVLAKNGFQLESVRKKGVIKNNQLLDEHFWVKIF